MKAGITGHQNIEDSTKEWLYSSMSLLIKRYNIDYGYSNLAIGADQLFVECLRSLSISFTFILPCMLYDNTFKSIQDKTRYLILKSEANDIIELNYDEPSEEAFYEGGKKIVDLSEIMFAIWDGKKAKGLGGTGDIVEYSKEKGKKLIHLNTEEMKIFNI